ncbi:hypothetical protein SLA_6179 [Streptomyces laurentii]|uniref:Uncharacterized protein n=1 Tax=Streptomyces laurentii TaxID=39478 RepID=A0A169PA72_STRLU|nr:hypothetical protein SLA_6179 [Streptomyces laurentii]
MAVTGPSPKVLKKLDKAMRRRAAEQRHESTRNTPTPPPPGRPTAHEDVAPFDVTAAGNAVSKTFFTDHYFGYPYGDLWMYDGTNWHGLGTLTAQDEQGAMQIAFAANRVEVTWQDNGNVSSIRCWKFLT